MSADARLIWWCTSCEYTIEDEAGYLTVHRAAVSSRQGGMRTTRGHAAHWAAAQFAQGRVALAGFIDPPTPVRWEVLHARCDGAASEHEFRIPVDEMRSACDVIRWAARLSAAPWVAATDWHVLLDGISHVFAPSATVGAFP